MKKVSKLIAVILVIVMTLTTLTACSKEKKDDVDAGNKVTEDNKDNGKTSEDKTDDKTGDNSSKDNTSNTNDEQITLTFASWALGTAEDNNIERRIIAAYEEAHPNVKIQIADDIISSDNWNEALATAAAGGTLPDVITIASLPTAVASGWAYDISKLAAADEDWARVPSYLRDSGAYGNGQYGIPSAMNLAGFYINTDLFAAENVTPLSYGYTFADWENTLVSMSAPNRGVIALKHGDIVDWYPAVKNSSFGWFTYDGKEVHLDDPLFIEGVKYATSINDNDYAFNGLSEEQKTNFGVPSDWEAWNAGKVAMAYDGTWASTGLAKDMPFTTKFVGLPDSKSVIIPDYFFIGSSTKYPEAAYDFARYVSFAKEGILKRLDIVESNEGVTWGSLPLIIEDEVIDRFFKNYPVEGVKEVFENMEGNTFVEAFKFTPGYISARWQAPTGIKVGDNDNASIADVINACMNGTLNIDDYASQLNTLSNQYISEEAALIDAITK